MLKSRTLWSLFVLACFFMACKTDPPYDRDAQAAIDELKITHFIDSLGIPRLKTGSGLYYQILEEGTGTKQIDSLDTAFVRYVGRFLEYPYTVFDSTATLTDSTIFAFYTAMPAWVEGIRLIAPGGEIRLFVPSTLAYQNVQLGDSITTIIPPNTVLDFDIKLLKINKYIPPVTTTQ